MQNSLHSFLTESLCFAFIKLTCNVLKVKSPVCLSYIRSKAFPSLFVNFFFPSTSLQILHRASPFVGAWNALNLIAVLGMFNSLDSSALFFTDSDSATTNYFVSVVSSTLFQPKLVGKMVFKRQHQQLSLNLCINTSRRLECKENQGEVWNKLLLITFSWDFCSRFLFFFTNSLFIFSAIFPV